MVDGKNSPLHEEHVRFSTPISPKQQKLIYSRKRSKSPLKFVLSLPSQGRKEDPLPGVNSMAGIKNPGILAPLVP